MHPKVVIATTTKYARLSDLRCQLALKMVMLARNAGHHVVVVDDSTDKVVRDQLRNNGAEIFPQRVRGMGGSRRESFFWANEMAKKIPAPIILWLESEKFDLIRWIPRLIEPIVRGDADIVMPCRSEKSWQTYPEFQRKTEREINKVYNETVADNLLIGDGEADFDPAFGPVAFHCKFARYFIRCDGRNMKPPIPDTYITHYAPPFAVVQENARMISVEVDFTYPRGQRQEEEGPLAAEMEIKRRRQRDELINGYPAIMNTLNILVAEESD